MRLPKSAAIASKSTCGTGYSQRVWFGPAPHTPALVWLLEQPNDEVQIQEESELVTGAFAVPSMRMPPLLWYGPLRMRSAPAHTLLLMT